MAKVQFTVYELKIKQVVGCIERNDYISEAIFPVCEQVYNYFEYCVIRLGMFDLKMYINKSIVVHLFYYLHTIKSKIIILFYQLQIQITYPRYRHTLRFLIPPYLYDILVHLLDICIEYVI